MSPPNNHPLRVLDIEKAKPLLDLLKMADTEFGIINNAKLAVYTHDWQTRDGYYHFSLYITLDDKLIVDNYRVCSNPTLQGFEIVDQLREAIADMLMAGIAHSKKSFDRLYTENGGYIPRRTINTDTVPSHGTLTPVYL